MRRYNIVLAEMTACSVVGVSGGGKGEEAWCNLVKGSKVEVMYVTSVKFIVNYVNSQRTAMIISESISVLY